MGGQYLVVVLHQVRNDFDEPSVIIERTPHPKLRKCHAICGMFYQRAHQ